MLPTKGYFQDIECPYFNNSCGRPYCHFRHKKKQQDNLDEGSCEETSSKEVPTYKPTPKSELAVNRSHIPISYVPDIIYRADKPLRTIPKTSFLTKPIYKPTPISLLASAVKNTDNSADSPSISEIKQSIANTKYSPEAENILEVEYKPTSLEDKIINENLEKHEYKPGGEVSSNVQYNPTALSDITDHNSSDVAYKPTSDNLKSVPNIDYKPSALLADNCNINFENLTNEFDMIDEIINMSNKSKNAENPILVKQSRNDSDTCSDNKVLKGKDSLIKDKSSKSFHKDETNQNKSSSHRSERKSKQYLKDKVEDRSNKHKKHSSTPKTTSNKSTSKEKRDKDKSRPKDKECRKEKYEVSNKVKSKDVKKGKIKSSHGNKDEKKEKNQPVKSCKEHDEKKRKTKSEEKEHVHHKKTDRKDKDRHKSSRHKEKTKDSSKYSENDKKYKESKRAKSVLDKKSKSEISKTESEKVTELLNINHKTSSRDSSVISDDNFVGDIDFDIYDEDETMRECYKIFNEYAPTEVTVQTLQCNDMTPNEEVLEEPTVTKKRIAHSNAPTTSVSSKLLIQKPVSLPTPGQVMNNRLKTIKAMQANNEGKLIANEVMRAAKRPALATPVINTVKKSKVQSTPKPSTSLVDDIINGNKPKMSVKKIAPVTNVLNIQRAKAQLEELNKKRAAELVSKTAAQTSKVGKRQAHVPEYSLNDIPDVLDAEKSKLPVNVRTRFLTMLGNECCKLYLSPQDAYKRALDEEYSCYQKCKVLVTYRNSAMLAVNRIRKELQEREQNDLGPLGSGESSLKGKENSDKIAIYEQFSRYILSEEELDIHGYPRESNIPGRAFIKNQKSMSIVPLPKNQKKCSRCSKIYLVDEGGRVIYEEECLYHPLRKRTIRGEQIYLCCKSTDDSGCATSHTHVCEMSQNAELEGYQATMCPDNDNDPRSYAVYALDCEMCYTTKGLELTRVTIVDTNCKTVYESLVKPLNEITDYNTRFSGITKQQMDRINTGILQVQANILHLCNSRTILIGHSLESDMKALKIVHSSIVDTSVLFPHKMGLPHKRALKALASDYLKKIIQNDISGHDSAEDAITCMELVKWKIKEDTKFKFSK